ncbi:hypothetical protein Goari_008875, partial [Gossypium aridum]|nr:hypothetical protein [Gossypium aridum]
MSISRQREIVGRAFRGPSGEWLVGFEMVTCMVDIFQIEARVILKGLKLGWIKGFVQVEVESDNAVLIDTIISGFAANSNTIEVRLIHEWCNRNWQVKLRHVLRESYKVVDCLTKTARGGMNQLVVLVDLPSH